MKNIIAITSLLAAGTLLANAATYDFTNIALTTGQGTQKHYSNGGAITTNDGISVAEFVKLIGFGVGNYGGSARNGSTNDVISDTDWATGDCTVSGSLEDGYTISMKGRIGVGGEWFGTVLEVSNVDLAAAKLTATLPTFNGNDFTLGIVGYSTASSSVVNYITQDFTASNSEISLLLEGLNSTVDRLAFIIDGPAGTGKTTYNVTNLSFSTGVVALPEPSAFGLLAGLGALALAGTRRRRRKA